MDPTKSFRDILQEKMTKIGHFSEGKATHFTQKIENGTPLSHQPVWEILWGNIDPFISSKPFLARETWFSMYRQEYKKFVCEEKLSVEIPIKKPQWTEAQRQAIEQLIHFGAYELSEFSTVTEVKKAFRRLAKKYHPDTLLGQPENIIREKSQQFILIHKSYKQLIESDDT